MVEVAPVPEGLAEALTSKVAEVVAVDFLEEVVAVLLSAEMEDCSEAAGAAPIGAVAQRPGGVEVH